MVHAQDAEGEQQSERVSVECVGRVDDGAGDGSSEARRGHVEGEGGVEGCDEGADDVEQGASMAARVAEGDDEDEAMAGDENVSGQRAEGGGGSTGGIKKKKPQTGDPRARRTISSDRWRSNMHGAGPRCRVVRYCPSGCESGLECARAC